MITSTSHIAGAGLRFRYPGNPGASPDASSGANVWAIFDAEFSVRQGERVALVGRNGSGKSTLMRLICGLLPCQDGEIFYRGEAVTQKTAPAPLPGVGILFQDPDDHLFCNTVAEDVAFGLLNQGKGEESRRLALHWLEKVGLAEKAASPPHFLSHGQKKRAALAAVLAMEPELLLLDEPSAGLDPTQAEAVAAILAAYRGSLIIIDHDLPFLARLCDRVIVLSDGAIGHDEPMASLMRHPHNLREHGLDFSFRLSGQRSARPANRPASHHHYQPGHRHDDDGGAAHEHGADACLLSQATLPLLELQHFSYRYPDGGFALADINLGIQAGERVALIGENGAGKSTLAACLLGLRVGAGQYFHHGHEVGNKTRRELWRHIGMVFQNSADQLFCPSCFEEVAFGPKQMRRGKEETARRVAQALTAVRLTGYEERVPLHLSGGEKKRLTIASMLAMEPELLILDEPTAGLDPASQEILLGVLEDIAAAYLLITHDLFFARRLCSRAVVLHHGEIIHDGANFDEFIKP